LKNQINGVLLLIYTIYLNYTGYIKKKDVESASARVSFVKAIEYVKKEKPTPPEAAIFYAEVATDIYNGKNDIDESYLSEKLENVLEKENSLVKVKLQKGDEKNEYWVGKDPFSPNIGSYPRFFLKEDFTHVVPPPPKYKSKEFEEALGVVKYASDNRTSEHDALINFWGGIPGTETPSGIWQNRLWGEFQNNPKFKNIKGVENMSVDKQYAYVQMILAQSLADSFLECWKTKYTYQTKRPDMTNKEIKTAMPNPKFPGYVSGHSTISFTAANILSNFMPDNSDGFYIDAENAKNSRLWAGIHFPYDNNEGENLGMAIGDYIIDKIK
jgi:hypothetical protein